jgi:branched-chain amino acid transport system permease protein
MAQQLINALTLGSIYTLFALGLTLSWGVLGILNLAHGALFMSGGLAAWLLVRDAGIPFAVLLVACPLVGGLLAVLLERLVFRPIRHRYPDAQSAEFGMLIASVGVAAIPVTFAVVVTNDEIKDIGDATFAVTTWSVAGLRVTNIAVLMIVLALVLSIALAAFIQRTRHGHALRALAFDPGACEMLGISSGRLASITMFVAGALAALGGLLVAVQLGTVQARMGEPLMLKAFAVIILGGVGSLGGGVFAAYLLALVETLTLVYVSPDLKDVVAFALIIALLILRPQGLFARAAWERA